MEGGKNQDDQNYHNWPRRTIPSLSFAPTVSLGVDQDFCHPACAVNQFRTFWNSIIKHSSNHIFYLAACLSSNTAPGIWGDRAASKLNGWSKKY